MLNTSPVFAIFLRPILKLRAFFRYGLNILAAPLFSRPCLCCIFLTQAIDFVMRAYSRLDATTD